MKYSAISSSPLLAPDVIHPLSELPAELRKRTPGCLPWGRLHVGFPEADRCLTAGRHQNADRVDGNQRRSAAQLLVQDRPQGVRHTGNVRQQACDGVGFPEISFRDVPQVSATL